MTERPVRATASGLQALEKRLERAKSRGLDPDLSFAVSALIGEFIKLTADFDYMQQQLRKKGLI
jgi:hypothetical protein